MKSNPKNEFDLIILGGGPSGSTLAALVALRGWKVLLLEKDNVRRYQIGESLLPGPIHGVLALARAKKKVLEAGFYKKYGGTFLWGKSILPWSFHFLWTDGEPVYSLQVDRGRFDKILLDHAKSLGVKVRTKSQATKLISENGRVCGVQYLDAKGTTRNVKARHVADASGSRSRFFSSAGERVYAPTLKNAAAWAYFRGGKRQHGKDKGNTLTVAFDGGWFWYIPITDNITSVGVIASSEAFAGKKIDKTFLEKKIEECPLIKDFLAEARMITRGKFGQVRVQKDWSYCNKSFSSPGFCLVGDAACFVDPVFSTGVHLGTYGSLQAARAINSSLADPDREELYFEEFERKYKSEFGIVYQFVNGLYSMHERASPFWKPMRLFKANEKPHLSFSKVVAGIIPPSEIFSSLVHRNFPTELQRRLRGSFLQFEATQSRDGKTNPAKTFLDEKWFRLDRDLPDSLSKVTLCEDSLGWNSK